MQYTLRLLGGASLAGPDGPLTGQAAQRRRLALLALLALARDGTLSRDKLIAYLWPEVEAERARHYLSVAVHALRSALGEEAIVSAGDDVRLARAVVGCDCLDFDTAVDAGDVERAVALYGGPFLDGFHLGSESVEFDQWADGQRTRLAARYATALERAAEAREARGDLAGTVELWRRRVTLDPYASRTALGLMHALDRAGDRAGALQHARLHATLLRTELEAEPDQAVASYAERLRAAPHTDAPADVRPEQATLSALPATTPSATLTTAPRPDGAPVARRRRIWLAGTAVAAVMLLLLSVVAARTDRASRAPGSRAPSAAGITSLAVLPFAAAPADEYFGDGMTDELAARLAEVEGLRIAARSSSFALRGQPSDARDVGKRLGVDAVLEGSVRRSADRLRVTVQLVDTKSGYFLWSDSYERGAAELFDVQDDIARNVLTTLRPWLGESRGIVLRRPTEDLTAYDHYLKGRHAYGRWGAWNEEGAVREAIRQFQAAIARDPSYPAAHAWLARAYIALTEFVPPREVLPAAKRAVVRAVLLDSTVPEVRVALGDVHMIHDRDWRAAERQFRAAIALDTASPLPRTAYARFLRAARRWDEALAQAQKSLELQRADVPDSVHQRRQRSLLAMDAYLRGDLAKAERLFRQLVAERPVDWTTRWQHGLVLSLSGDHDEAIRELEIVREQSKDALPYLTHLGLAYAFAGRTVEARTILRELESRAARTYVPKDQFASLHLGLGDTTRALELLERAVDDNHWWMYQISQTPLWRPLYSNPRFLALVDRVGAPRPR